MISGMDVMVNWVERARMLAVAAVLTMGTAHAEKTVVFFTPWSNTNAVLFVGGDSVATMTPLENYCGWFKATVDAPAEGFGVYFKQTVGLNYVGAEGMVGFTALFSGFAAAFLCGSFFSRSLFSSGFVVGDLDDDLLFFALELLGVIVQLIGQSLALALDESSGGDTGGCYCGSAGNDGYPDSLFHTIHSFLSVKIRSPWGKFDIRYLP